MALAALGLVAAVWLSLRLSQATAPEGGATDGPEVRSFGALPGFLPERAYLPDDPLLGFVEVPGGAFLMGSDPARDPAAFDIERWSPEQTQGEVELPTYYVGRYEVTVAQYAAFVASSGHRVVDPQALAGPGDHPVASVAWTDALAYIRWLQGELERGALASDSLASLISVGYRVRLPTEAEWEKAARGSDGRIYPWGDEPRRDRATFLSSRPTPVGTYGCPECPYPVHDLAGNVWEWTRSPYQPYPYDPDDDRADLQSEALWVMRGGSYGDPAHFVRAANRGGADPGARRPFIGFRLVLARR